MLSPTHTASYPAVSASTAIVQHSSTGGRRADCITTPRVGMRTPTRMRDLLARKHSTPDTRPRHRRVDKRGRLADCRDMAHKGMTFGIFLAPFHRLGENPTLALNRDMELIEWLDWLGYDEVWVGEHHSAGWELIASPEIFIAAAAERTRHIRLGSGVTSLPYHHPFLVAQRFVQLDHMTRGRAMLGCGPGALVSDAYMMGIEPVT